MSMIAHLESLKEKKAGLENAVAAEAARPLPDFAKITEMKKQKLALKEEILRLSALVEAREYQEAS